MLYILLIVIIIILYQKNKEINKENEELKKRQPIKTNFCPNCGFNLNKQATNNSTKINNQEQTLYFQPKQNITINQNTKTIKPTENEIKNSLILIVGSILIILSAIVFLTTTWNITHNIFKTLIIILMLFVFLTASHIADKYLKLKQTSKAFYYIALAYLPILFLSISLFSLFGKYFSIYGLGKYIYFTICSVIITIIYYEQSKKRESQLIGIASIIFSFLSVLFLSLSIDYNISFLILMLCIYNTILCILYQQNIFYLNQDLHKKILLIITPSLIIIMCYNNIWNMIKNKPLILDIFIELLMFYNINSTEEKINKNNNINIIYPLYIMFTIFNISCFFNSFIIKQIFIILGSLLIFIYDLIRKDTINQESYIETIICLSLLYISSLIYSIDNTILLPSYTILIIISILSIMYYKANNKQDNLISPKIFSGSLILAITDFIIKNNLSIIYLGYSSLIFIAISQIIKKDTNLKQSLYWTGNAVFIATSLINYQYNIYWTLLFLIYSILSLIIFYKEKNNMYKIFGYIYINFVLLSINKELDIIYIAKILPITTIIYILIETIYKKLNNETTNYYIIIQYIISIVLLNSTSTSLSNFILLLLTNIIFTYYIKQQQWNNNYLYLPALSLIPYIYLKDLLIYNSSNYMYIISILFIMLFTYLIYNKKINIYIALFYIYTSFHILSFHQSHYISLLIIFIGTYITYHIKTNNSKDLFKAILYTCGLAFLQFIFTDLKIPNIVSPLYASFLIWIPFITRDILKKYTSDYKILEYIGYILINLTVIQQYASEFDGIIFVFFLTIIVIISYLYKLGPIFIVSLISILINVLLLTRTFWLSIPWWLYILLIGSVLIGFAIYNEANSNKNIVKNIKDKLDL